jgi:predicted nucleic acid-binding protein
MFLLDTCVISEGNRPLPDRNVDSWFASQRQEHLFLSALSVGELHYGVEKLPAGRKKTGLRRWFEETVIVGFSGRVLYFDAPAAVRWGELRAKHRNAGTVDTQIAATALAFGFTLVTRNVKHFAFDGLLVLDPWQK